MIEKMSKNTFNLAGCRLFTRSDLNKLAFFGTFFGNEKKYIPRLRQSILNLFNSYSYLLLSLLILFACEKQTFTNYDHLYHSLQQQFRGQLHFLYSLDEATLHYIQDNPYFNYQDLPNPAKDGVNCFTQLRFQTITQQLQYQSAFDEERLQNDLSFLLEEYLSTRPIPIQTTPCLQLCWQSNFHCIAQEMLHLTIHSINTPNGDFFRSTFKTLNTSACTQAFTTCSEACNDG